MVGRTQRTEARRKLVCTHGKPEVRRRGQNVFVFFLIKVEN